MNEREIFETGDSYAGAPAGTVGGAATTGAGPGPATAYSDMPYPPPGPMPGPMPGPAVGYGYGPVAPPPYPSSTGNPATAFVLGFIPGVGAMYNGQFAKGLTHIVIFAVLITLTSDVNGIFGIFIAGWIAYMVFDAYQTARARRDGLQAPDPFGLNNIGERIGFGQGPNWSDFVAKPMPGAVPPGTAQSYASAAPSPYAPVSPSGVGPGSPGYSTTDPRYASAAYPGATDATGAYARAAPGVYSTAANVAGVGGGYGPTAGVGGPNPFGTPYAASDAPPYAAPYAPYAPGQVPPSAVVPDNVNRSGLPSGALWLIGLGVLALVSTLGHEFFLPSRVGGGVVLIILGIALVIRRLQEAQRLYPADTAAATWYSIRSSKGGIFLAAIGSILLISAAHWHVWRYSWPYLLILLGVYQIVERAAYNRMVVSQAAASTPPTSGSDHLGGTAPPTPPAAPSGNTDPISIFPRSEEGR